MASQKDSPNQTSARHRLKPSKDDLDRMVEEATVDAGAVPRGSDYPFWIWPCRSLRQKDGNGSRRTGTERGRFLQYSPNFSGREHDQELHAPSTDDLIGVSLFDAE